MLKSVRPEAVAKALGLIFGEESTYSSVEHMNDIDAGVLKSAFRSKAKFLHPDRAMVLGLNEGELNELFKQLHVAYRYLNRVLSEGDIPELLRKTQAAASMSTGDEANSIRTGRPGTTYTSKQDGSSVYGFSKRSRYYAGKIPKKALRFAQFLYYSGIIDWQTMIDAITWQMSVRPRIGEIGRSYRFFDSENVRDVIMASSSGEFFGSVALRLGLIDHFKLNVMLGKQRKLNRPIGRFFVENGLFSPAEINTLIKHNRSHNLWCRSR